MSFFSTGKRLGLDDQDGQFLNLPEPSRLNVAIKRAQCFSIVIAPSGLASGFENRMAEA